MAFVSFLMNKKNEVCQVFNLNKEVFLGNAGGSRFNHTGAAVEPLCLPRKPEWGSYRDGVEGVKNYVFGAEYETHSLSGYWLTLHNHDVPCAVCLVRNRSLVKMFPGKNIEHEGNIFFHRISF